MYKKINADFFVFFGCNFVIRNCRGTHYRACWRTCAYTLKIMNIKINTLQLKSNVSPYYGVFFFVSLLLSTHLFWKIVVDGDLQGQQIYIFGRDLTSQFHSLSTLTAEWAFQLIKLFPNTDSFYRHDTYLYFEGGRNCINIIWGCTAIKQLYIFILLIILYKGPVKSKLWYIPVGCLILGIYNIIRIAMICILTKNNPERFESLHDGWFKYLFYGLIFLLWVFWEERFVKKDKSFVKE